MSMTATPATPIRDTIGLSDKEAARRAEDMARSDPGLTAQELARRFGRGERWGRRRLAAVRPSVRPDAPPASAASVPVSAPPAAERPQRPVRASARTRAGQAERPPRVLLAVTGAGAVVVTAVCAVVSYVHIQHLAAAVGMGGVSWWLPLGIDGLVAVCSCSLILDRQLRRPVSVLARAGVAAGFAGSVAGNVVAVDPSLAPGRTVAWLLAGYPALALAVVGHQLLRMLADR